MGTSNLDSTHTVYKHDIISAAEALMINCHHLASDILDLAQNEAGIEPGQAQTLSRQLSEWAGQLAATVQAMSGSAEAGASTVAGCSQG